MSREDFVYLCLLIVAIPFGHIVKVSGSPARKKHVSFFAGLFLLYTIVGLRAVPHSFVAILGTYLIMRILGPRYGPWSVFIYVFSYLFFYRTCHWYGFTEAPPYSNAVQLLVTLRMCTIAFEGFEFSCHEPRKSIKNDQSTQPTMKISLYDIFAYGYCYCGLLTGPYYRFVTYIDMLHQKNSEDIPTFKHAITRLKYLPFHLAIYIPLNKFFPISHMLSPEFANHPWGLLYRLAYLVPTFQWFRWRFYIGWLLAESSCITMGLGAYPEECKCKPGLGPSVEVNGDDAVNKNVNKYDFETIRQIRIYKIEFTPNMTTIMKNWNMTVQWWLAAYVNRKLPFSNRKLRMSIVLFVSAFWHGVKGGYYLCFMTVPLIVMAESRMERVVQPSSSERNIFDWVNWFLLYRTFEYLSCGFMLLEKDLILQTLSLLYYYMHIVLLILIILPSFLPRRRVAENGVFSNTEVELSKKDS